MPLINKKKRADLYVWRGSEALLSFLSDHLQDVSVLPADDDLEKIQNKQQFIIVGPGGSTTFPPFLRSEKVLYLQKDGEELLKPSISLPKTPNILLKLIRQWLMEATKLIRFGRWEYAPFSRRLIDGAGKETALTEKESDILLFFLENPNKPFSKEQLLPIIWGYHPDITTRTLETHIYKLRKKIEENPESPKYLKTEDSGYIFNERPKI